MIMSLGLLLKNEKTTRNLCNLVVTNLEQEKREVR